MPTSIGRGQLSLVDLNDVVASATAPSNPTDGMLWWNGTELQVYQNGGWKPSSNIIVGGRNLLRKTAISESATTNHVSGADTWTMPISTKWYRGYGIKLEKGQTYTLSFNYELDWTNVTMAMPTTQSLIGVGIGSVNTVDGTYNADTFAIIADFMTYGQGYSKGKFKYTFTYNRDTTDYFAFRALRSNTGVDVTKLKITLSNMQLEKGNIATDWSPYIDEVEDTIEDIQETLGNMANDNLLDIQERKVIKDKLTEILGFTPIEKTTSDFAGKVINSTVANPNVVYRGAWSTLQTPASVNTEISVQDDYNRMMALDGTVIGSGGASTTNGNMGQQRFKFDLVEIVKRKYGFTPSVNWLKANISKITTNWHGKGSSPSGNKATLYMWRADTGVWEATGAVNNTSSIAKLTAITNAPNLRVDANGFVHFLAFADASNGTAIPSIVETDYINIELEFSLLPTIANIDLLQVGDLYSYRKSALNAGLTTSAPEYIATETKYNALKTYLDALTPIPSWDTSDANKDTNITVVKSDFRNKWVEYYQSVQDLAEVTAKKLKDETDSVRRLTTKGIGMKVNYSTFSATNSGELYIHGYGADGNPADVDGYLVVNGVNMVVPKFVINPDLAIANGYIVYDKTMNKWYIAYIQSNGTWYRVDASITNGTFTPDANHYFCGTFNLPSAEGTAVATLWNDYKDYIEMGFYATQTGKMTSVESKVTDTAIINTVKSSETFRNVLDTDREFMFYNGAENWRNSHGGTTAPTVTIVKDGIYGGSSIEVSGTQWIYYGTPIPVKTDNTYKVKFRVKQTVDPTTAGTSKVYAGVASFDANKATLSTGTYGTHRWCAVQNVNLTVADGWQEFEGIISGEGNSNYNQFIPNTRFAVPVFVVNFSGGNGKTLVDICSMEDITDINNLGTKLQGVEQKISSSGITTIITESDFYNQLQSDLSGKVSTETLGDYATKGELDDVNNNVATTVNDAIIAQNIPATYATKLELSEKASDITAKFSATGGMNLLKNSIGFAEFDSGNDWKFSQSTSAGIIDRVSNDELNTLGFGSGFSFPARPADGDARRIRQIIPVVAGESYTLSWYINRSNSSGSLRIEVFDGNDVTTGTPLGAKTYGGTDKTEGYVSGSFVIEPKQTYVTISIFATGLAEAIVTGLMFSIGDIALQWSLATGELFNTNIRLDVRGIRVSQIDNGKEIGYTQITPSEFAGYYDADKNGVFDKIFYLNGEETVTKKLKALDEITMGTVRVINMPTGSSNVGWAWIAIVEQ